MFVLIISSGILHQRRLLKIMVSILLHIQINNNKLMKKRKQLEDVQTNHGINTREIKRRKSTNIKRTTVEGMEEKMKMGIMIPTLLYCVILYRQRLKRKKKLIQMKAHQNVCNEKWQHSIIP